MFQFKALQEGVAEGVAWLIEAAKPWAVIWTQDEAELGRFGGERKFWTRGGAQLHADRLNRRSAEGRIHGASGAAAAVRRGEARKFRKLRRRALEVKARRLAYRRGRDPAVEAWGG